MKMDLKHFKKLHSNDKSTTFVHKNGHKIIVAHSGVDEGMRKQLSELPKFQDGGTVSGLHADYSQDQKRVQAQESYSGKKVDSHQDSDAEYAQRRKSFGQDVPRLQMPAGMAKGGVVQHYDAGTADAQPGMSLPENTAMGNAGMNDAVQPDYSQMMSPMSPQQATSEQPQLQNVAIPQPPQPQQNLAQSLGNQATSMQDNMKLAEQGINDQAAAEAKSGRQEAKIEHDRAADAQTLQNNYKTASDAIDNERMQVYNDLKNGHIEPNHFVQSMGGFQKGMTAIGLILSGMGSGLAGQSNMAMDFLNKQIDRDIDGQKAEMGKKENLLSHLNQQMGNLRDATTMAKALQSDMYAAKILEVAAQSKDPMAMSRAKQAVAELHFSKEPMVQDMKMRQSILGGLQNGSMAPEQAIPVLVPKEQQPKAFDNMGKLQDLNKNRQTMLNLFDQADKENTLVRTAGGIRTPGSVMSLQNMMLPQIKDLEGRVNEFEFNSLKNFIPSQGDTPGKVAAKRSGFENFLNQKQNEYESNLRGFGVPLPASPKGLNKR